ncbi:MAG: hypothetical protein M1834_008893 [Cirrosporium novae-zelandiae]|nr:MAG: hypothetical protein M1834_008893 [Cirrosporium novae-zelandiae]
MTENTIFPGVAVITGAAGTGIGASIARAFADANCQRIAITDINSSLLKITKEEIEKKHPSVTVYMRVGDITSEEFVDSFIESTVAEFGRIDYCVNCAGVLGACDKSTDTSMSEFDRVNGVNYRGCWLSSRAELRAMLKQEPLPSHDCERPSQRGSIVNIASILGLIGMPCSPIYCASKAAVVSMTRADAIDYSEYNIRVNCICPGLTETPMIKNDKGFLEWVESVVEATSMKRLGKASEIADCAVFLSSTKASFVQGQAMVVDGGYFIR